MKRTQHYLNEIARTTNFFYMISDEELAQLKKCFLVMYKDVYAVCEKYKMTLMVAGGTTIGAVRHKGFIPWDDDFDMMMPREDYNKLISVFEQELGDKYILSVPGRQEESKTLFLQIIRKGTRLYGAEDVNRHDADGIRVDIYPIDRMPDNKYWRLLKCHLLDLIRILAISVTIFKTKDSLFRKAFQFTLSDRIYYRIRWSIGLICSVFGKKNWYNFHNKFASSSKGKNWCSLPTCDLAIKELQPRDVFFPPKEAEFEGLKVYIPNNVDAYLSQLYGDYMTLPPLDKRERHFYVEKPNFGDILEDK